MDLINFKISSEEAGLRLDAFLASHIEGWSRARLQRLIEAEDVLVNGKFAIRNGRPTGTLAGEPLLRGGKSYRSTEVKP